MALFIITFISIFLLGFQQQCVVHGNYKLAFTNAIAIGCSQFFLYRGAAFGEPFDWIYMGLGGAVGITTSMYVHRRWVSKRMGEK